MMPLPGRAVPLPPSSQSKKPSPRSFAVAVLLLLACSGVAMASSPVIIYDTIPAPLPPNVPSETFQAGHVAEFGDLIQFAGTNRALTQVTLVMSDWSVASAYPSFPGASGPTWNCAVRVARSEPEANTQARRQRTE